MATISPTTFSYPFCWQKACVFLFKFNTLRPRQNGRHFADDIFKRIFFNENVWISIKISLKFVPKGPINKIPALVQVMAWRRSGDKPLSEPMMVSLLTHICVTQPQWVNQSLFLKVQFTISQHLFRWWLGTRQATSHKLNQCWPRSMMSYSINRPQWVKICNPEINPFVLLEIRIS